MLTYLATLLFAVLLACYPRHAVEAEKLRGVSPELEVLYSGANGLFQCLDGSGSVPFDAVNDDFCDCSDGSDEPGTSACLLGRFYCSNRGHKPKVLAAQFVDDKICDCCDGSDEEPGTCGNRCGELGRKMRESVEAQLRVVQEGLKIKAGRIAEGIDMKKGWEQELLKLEPLIEKQNTEVEKLRAEKEEVDKVEAEEAEKAEKAREAEETLKREQEEKQCKNGEAGADGFCPSGDAGESKDSEGVDEGEVQQQGEAAEASSQSDRSGDSENSTPEDVGVHGVDESGMDDGVDEDEAGLIEEYPEEGDGFEDFGAEDVEDAGEEDYDPEYDQDEGGTKYEGPEESTKGSGFFGTFSSLANSMKEKWFGGASEKNTSGGRPAKAKGRVQELSKELSQAERELRDLKEQQEALKSKIERNHGPDDAYLSLEGKCFETAVDKYRYEMCPFGEAKQVEGTSSTKLGSWHGFDESKQWVTFSGGRSCWNGPQRSLRVHLQCGNKDELTEITEPNMCEYLAVFRTPGACNQALIDRLQAQLEELDPGIDAKSEL